MILKKKWWANLSIMAFVLLLSACGDENSASGNTNVAGDGPQDSSSEEFTAISEGLEEYSVWFKTYAPDGLERTSSVDSVYIVENGNVTAHSNISGDELNLEEINKLNDEEIIQYYTEKKQLKTEGKYTLDIKLDSVGQNTEKVNLILTNGSNIRTYDLEAAASEKYNSSAWNELVVEYPDFESYLSALKKGEEPIPSNDNQVELNGDEVISTEPIEDESILTFETGMIQQTIFDTTYSGLIIGEYDRLITRVDDSFFGFTLDGPNTDKENVTIEKYE